jgi:hypothetical protein
MDTVDASVWVNAFDQREPGHLVSRQLLEVLQSQHCRLLCQIWYWSKSPERSAAHVVRQHRRKRLPRPGTEWVALRTTDEEIVAVFLAIAAGQVSRQDVEQWFAQRVVFKQEPSA